MSDEMYHKLFAYRTRLNNNRGTNVEVTAKTLQDLIEAMIDDEFRARNPQPKTDSQPQSVPVCMPGT